MREPGEVLVLVEGYDDRAFWAGFLREVCGCTASVDLPLNRYRQLEPGLQSLLKQKRGTYCYLTQSERTVVRVVPYQEQGKGTNLWTLFDENVLGRHTRSDAMLRGIVVCRDDDGRS